MQLSLQTYTRAALPEQFRVNNLSALIGQEEWTETGAKLFNNLFLQCGQEFLNLTEAMGSVLKLLENR